MLILYKHIINVIIFIRFVQILQIYVISFIISFQRFYIINYYKINILLYNISSIHHILLI